MKVFKKDFKENLKTAIIWTLAAALMGFLQVSVYGSMVSTSIDQWETMLDTMPKAMIDAFEITSSTFDDILSYYAMEGYLYVTLLISVFAALLGARLINKEESEKTSEFILTKPISRFRYITEKLFTLIIMIILSNITAAIIIYIGMLVGSNAAFSTSVFVGYSLGTLVVSISFGLIAFMISAVVKRVKGLSGMALGIVFLSFFLGIVSNISDTFSNLQYLSLFEYMGATDIINNTIPIYSYIVFICVIGLSIFFTYRIYLKKDIYN